MATPPAADQEPITKIDTRILPDILLKLSDPLDGPNWLPWRSQMNCVFKVLSLLPYVQGTIPMPDAMTRPAEYKAWVLNDTFAQLVLTQNVRSNQMNHIVNEKTVHDMWTALEGVHQPKDVRTVMANQRALFTTQAQEGDDIIKHLNRLKLLWERQKAFGDHLEEVLQVSENLFKGLVISSLPLSWDAFVQPYVDDERVSSQELIGIIRQECFRRKAAFEQTRRNDGPHSQGTAACKYCNGRNHESEDCWFKGARGENSKRMRIEEGNDGVNKRARV